MAQSDGESSASSDDETIDRLKEEVANLQVRFLALSWWWWHRDVSTHPILNIGHPHPYYMVHLANFHINRVWLFFRMPSMLKNKQLKMLSIIMTKFR